MWSVPAWSHAGPLLEPAHQESIRCHAQANKLTLSIVEQQFGQIECMLQTKWQAL